MVCDTKSDDIVDPTLASRSVPITVVIPTLNESSQIAHAIHDLWWADEAIVVDGGSTDGTTALAADAGARVQVVSGPNNCRSAKRGNFRGAQRVGSRSRRR